MSWGVVTMIAPLTGMRWARVSWMSPVPGGEVHHQVVQIAPVGVAQKLLERLGDHRPAPDHRGVFLDEIADRHRLDAVGGHGLERLSVARVRAGPVRRASAAGSVRRCRRRAPPPSRLRPTAQGRGWRRWWTCPRLPCRTRPQRCCGRPSARRGPAGPHGRRSSSQLPPPPPRRRRRCGSVRRARSASAARCPAAGNPRVTPTFTRPPSMSSDLIAFALLRSLSTYGS